MGRFLPPAPIVPEPFNPQSLNRYSYVMNDPVNRMDPTGQSSVLSGAGYFGESGGEFPQPPWERAGSIDLGLARSSPEYLGLRQQPDPISIPNMQHGPSPSPQIRGLGASPETAFAPSADLGPGHGLIPNAFNCGGE